ncbi:MAG: hypothetical protein JNG83_14870 [Opitutaceae bacterium]|nr:hypothetical protein [Opitutaceae bacterium]
MPATTPPFRLALRFCGSCLVAIGYWALWLGLGASLVTLAYVALAQELPVPPFLLRRAEAELAQADLVVRFGRARFDPSGKILIEDLELRSRQFEDPLLTCRLVYLRRDFWSVLAGRPIPDEIRIEGGVLQLPAILSPSGTALPLVHDLAGVVRHEDHHWAIDRAAGRIGRLTVTARGELASPAHVPGAPAVPLGERVARYLESSRRLAREIHRLDAFDEPALALTFESPAGVGNSARFRLTARGAERPWDQPLLLGPLEVTGALRLEGRQPRLVRLHVSAGHGTWRDDYALEQLRAVLTAETVPAEFSLRGVEAVVAAGSIRAGGEQVLGPVLRLQLRDWPAVHIGASAQLEGEFFAAEAAAALDRRSARVQAEGRVSPVLIRRLLERHTPRAAPYFVFGDPVGFAGDAELGPDWRFVRAGGRVDARRLDSRGVQVAAVRGRIDLAGSSFLAHDARIELAGSEARGSYWMDLATTDYRMLLRGRLQPDDINGWFRGNWWPAFWDRYFEFRAGPPAAEVDVQGRWKDPRRTLYFGRAESGPAVVWGGDFERVSAVLFLRPHFTDALAFSGERAGGREHLAGTFRRIGDPDTRETRRFEFNFDTDADPAVLNRMLGGRAADVLASLRFNRRPRIHAQGAIESEATGAPTRYTFTGRAEGGLHYYGFPLDDARVSGEVAGSEVRLDQIEVTAAGGHGAGKAALTGPAARRQLGFDFYLNGADFARTILAVEEYQANRTGQRSASVAESRFMKRAAGGRIDLALSASGEPGNLASFTGNGNASLTGAELGEVHLFGLLSQVLSGLSLNFSSLKLDAARTSFRLQEGHLYFPDLKVTGPTSVLDARGSYTFATNALDFTARFKPYEENRNLLTAAIGIVINPLTSILELKLTGPIGSPNWSIVVGQTNSRPPASPPPPAPPAPPPKS